MLGLTGNGLVAPMSQGKELQKIYPNKASKDLSGICESLAYTWIARHQSHKSEGPKERIKFVSSEETMLGAEMMQNFGNAVKNTIDALTVDSNAGRSSDAAFSNAIGQLKNQGGVRIALNNKQKGLDFFGLKESPTIIHGASVSDVTILTRIKDLVNQTSGVHKYHKIQIGKPHQHTGGTTGGHTMACYKSTGGVGFAHLYYFDANAGEYRVTGFNTSDHFKMIFDQYKGQNYTSVTVTQIS